MVDATERLQVLLSQEANTYRTTDYLTRIHEEHEEMLSRTAAASAAGPVAMEWEEAGDSCSHSSRSGATSSSPSSPKKRKSSSWDDDEVDIDATTNASTEQRGPSSERGGRQGHRGGQPTGTAESTSSNSSLINKHWREKICEWAYQGKFHKKTGSFV